MAKYNLDDSNGVRLDYCNLQATTLQVKECQTEYKAWLDSKDVVSVLFVFVILGVFGIGYLCGKVS